MMTFDSKEFRRAAGHFLTGVTVVTVRNDDGTPMGLTANSFTSVSLDPPLVLVCLDKSGGSYSAFRTGRVYAVHVLEEHQTELSTRFALHGGDKFAGLRCREGLGGVPILPEYLALFECTIVQAHDAGDHTIFVGRVERLDVSDSERRPLGFFRGKYIRVHRHPTAYVPDEVVELWGLGWA